jgi:hypothetical protein
MLEVYFKKKRKYLVGLAIFFLGQLFTILTKQTKVLTKIQNIKYS